MTQVIKTSIKNIDSIDSPSIISVGMFDSFHKYHQLIINELQNIAQKENLKKILLSFDRKPNKNIKTLLEEKQKIDYVISHFNLDYFFIIEVDEELIHTTKGQFVDILKNKLNVQKVVEGSDFKFGYKREGNITFLEKSFGSENVVVFQRNNNVSSSQIRKSVNENDLNEIKEIVDLELFKSDK